MEEEPAIVSYNIYNEQNYVDECVEKSSKEHGIILSTNNELEGLQGRIEEEQRRNRPMEAQPVVRVADKVCWEDGILTTLKEPIINYSKYVQPAKEPTSQQNLSFSMPQEIPHSTERTSCVSHMLKEIENIAI